MFSVIIWTNRLYDFDEGIYSPDNCYYEKKETFRLKKLKKKKKKKKIKIAIKPTGIKL